MIRNKKINPQQHHELSIDNRSPIATKYPPYTEINDS